MQSTQDVHMHAGSKPMSQPGIQNKCQRMCMHWSAQCRDTSQRCFATKTMRAARASCQLRGCGWPLTRSCAHSAELSPWAVISVSSDTRSDSLASSFST